MTMDDIRPTSPAPATPQPMPPAPKKARRESVAPAIIVFLVLLALAVWIMILSGRTKFDERGNLIRLAPEGEVVRDFPRELLPEEGAAVSQSYSINYRNDGANLPFVSYTSAKTFEENIAEFRRLLKAGGWAVLQDADETARPTASIYATKGEADVNITFTQKDGGVEVTIAYSEKQ